MKLNNLPNTLLISQPFVERDVDFETVQQLPHRNIVDFLTHWRKWLAEGIVRTDPSFKKSHEETWSGNKMRKMTVDELLNACAMLRLQHQEGVKFRKIDLDFIQGFEDYVTAGNKPDNRQRWRLGMLLVDYMEMN